MLPCYRGFWVSGDGLAALDTKWWWWWWRQDDHYHSPTLSWSFTVKGKCSLIEGKWSPFGGEFWKQIYHLSLAFVHFIKSTRKSWHGSDLPPLSGNARILEVPIPVTYPLFTGRLVGWRKDEGNAGQDTWGLWTILDEFSKNFQTASDPLAHCCAIFLCYLGCEM